jgi:hypothetical protein
MAKREVTRSRKDRDGDITALCNPGASWSPRQKRDAINDIESGVHQYFVKVNAQEVSINVVKGPTGKYLRTGRDMTSKNNLDDLPDC